MSKINGTNLVVYVNTGSGLQPCSFSQQCKLSVEMGTAAATTKDSSGWEEIIATNGKWSMDTSGLVDFHPAGSTHNAADLFTALTGKTLVTVAFQLTLPVTGDKSWSGTAYITKLEQNAKDKDVVSYTVNFQGTGALTMATS